jgi:thiol-disulfide isomerase/thioredoxin
MARFEQGEQKIPAINASRRNGRARVIGCAIAASVASVAGALGASTWACSREPEPAHREPEANGAAAPSAESAASSASALPNAASANAKDTIRFVDPPATGDVATIVATEIAKAKPLGRRVLVYVGATWCEPCQRFHQAAERGELDGKITPVTFVTFDLDRDRERLVTAGYSSKYIPLFALPDAEGTATSHTMEGSVKGAGAVAQIIPRLQALLNGS